MQPLCCESLESFQRGIGDFESESQMCPARLERTTSVPSSIAAADLRSDGVAVAGALYKWTNFGKGWRCRWFLLDTRNGSLSYSKERPYALYRRDVRLIGDVAPRPLGPTSVSDDFGNCDLVGIMRLRKKTAGVVHMKISSFRESKSDEKRFYIFTATKTLQLRTDSKGDRVAWIQALISLNGVAPRFTPSNLTVSTDRLKKRLVDEGVRDDVVNECEQIVRSEFTEVQERINVLCNERSTLLDTIRKLQAARKDGAGAGASPGVSFSEYELTKNEITSLVNGIFKDSTTPSSEENDKHEQDELSDGDEQSFHDTAEHFADAQSFSQEKNLSENTMQIERRRMLPDPLEKEQSVSLWSLIKDNVGKDLTKVCLPVYFNEPISLLQKCFEELEYSHLLDKAYECGRTGNSLMRILNVASFAVSGYASSKGRHCKPFNPLLGETYEAVYPEKGVRFLAEKVKHHPTIMACHCEGRGWKFWGDSNLCSKFWGQSIQLNPVGVLTLEFDDGETFQWSKVTSTVYNIVLGKMYCDHHGLMHIRGNRRYSCKIRFKDHSILERNPHQVNGFVEDAEGKRHATVFGKWDTGVYYSAVDHSSDPTLLWQSVKPPANLTRYNLSPFAITLNEITPDLVSKLPPTDSRLRPDQRHLENGEYGKANAEKQRLEKRQRMSRKLQEHGWRPKWFRKDDAGVFRYSGGYWETREDGNWEGCPDIFGEICEDS